MLEKNKHYALGLYLVAALSITSCASAQSILSTGSAKSADTSTSGHTDPAPAPNSPSISDDSQGSSLEQPDLKGSEAPVDTPDTIVTPVAETAAISVAPLDNPASTTVVAATTTSSTSTPTSGTPSEPVVMALKKMQKPDTETEAETDSVDEESIAVDDMPEMDLAETTTNLPIDISDQFTEIIVGVPIIESPKNCGQGDLEIGIVVENIKNTRGIIVADLHDDIKENFLVWDKVVLRVRQPAIKGEVSFCMPLTKPGDYAIAIYHDKNGNKEFDKNFLGIPKERFGMSSNPKFGLRSPKYEEVVFTVPENGKNIRIKLRKASDVLGGGK